MKNLLLAASLVLASCASTAPGSVPIAAEGPVARTIERVLSRTEVYMAAEVQLIPLTEQDRGVIEAAIMTARVMTAMPEADGDLLMVTMSGIMGLHDGYLMVDLSLDQLEREIYLEDTARLRSLFSSVSIHASVDRDMPRINERRAVPVN